nr:radical SAM protein [Clostridia bacterium]
MEQQIKEYAGLLDLLEDLEREGVTGYQRKEEYQRFMNLQARMRGQVHTASFELTPLCNFDCKMCYVHLSKGQMEREGNILSTAQWLDIMRQAVDAGVMHADLTGGECLTHPGFKELYLYLRSRGVSVSVLTNGQLIDEDMADFFAKYPPAMVQITIYGSNEDAYERVTGRRAFADVCAAVERLKKRGIHLFLPITPSQYMQEDTHALLEFLRGTGLRYGIGTGSLPARENTGRTRDGYEPSSDLYVKLHQDEQAYICAHQGERAVPTKRIVRVPKGFKTICKVPCSSGQCTCHINWKGEMQPCIPFHTVTRSVLEYGFDAAWAWIKQTMATYEPPQECGVCPHRAVCASCAAERTSGVLNGPVNKAVCERYAHYVQVGILNPPQSQDCQ